jgi:hypothetical protein
LLAYAERQRNPYMIIDPCHECIEYVRKWCYNGVMR